MAALVLTAAASALTAGSAAWVTSLATAAATIAGSYLDQRLFGATTKQQGPRLDSLQVQASTEGASIPEFAGRTRIAGQVIWATNFKEVAKTEKSGGKGGGGGVETTTYSYYANFAVGLCEGVIDRVGRIWADGKPLDMTNVTMRVYRGSADQQPDSLIEAIEGAGSAPAYRGTAYVVFDNLAIGDFGNRIPQLNFEVFRRVSPSDGTGLEDLIQAVTVIPGAGEFVYDTEVDSRDLGGGATAPENDFAGQARADWSVAMDDLQASLPNVNSTSLVVSWFGDDLRAGHCTVRPKVETGTKSTRPNSWTVHGVTRAEAQVVSTVDGRPAYGGTPSDDTVVRAIRDLKARRLSVTFYPFLSMDIANGNALPDPWTGAASQPVYPWRGRITCDPAPGQVGTADKTAAATAQVSAFFGGGGPADISVSVNASTNAVTTTWSGPAEWSYRRFILHCARLCAAINTVDPGAVDAFLIGSELKYLGFVRDSATNFPAVEALKALADDVKGILGPGVKVGYGADWSEYGGYNPGDGTGDVFFHLDPLWADANIDFVGVDLYAPMSDWRDGKAHLDAIAGGASIYDRAYLQANIEGGEDYDWFYASAADRDAQTRTPITDGTGKPWVFRAKDFRNWWSNQHFDRPGGVESANATAWVPESKPIWFTEFGIPSVDRGTNEPNVFYDPKSSESAFPSFSRGTRDDLIQRRGIEALLTYWADAAKNQTSSVYAGPMIGRIAIWTWDARPYPAWPARSDIWGDADQWPLGHWLNGKIGLADLAALVRERCNRVGFDAVDVTGLAGVVVGYVRDRPMSPRSEIETLMSAFFFDAVESEGVVRFVPRGRNPVASFTIDDCVLPDQDEPISLTRAQETDLPDAIAITFIDGENDYQSGSVSASRTAGYSDRTTSTSLALVMDEIQAQTIGDISLAEAWIGREAAKFGLGPSTIAIEPCDVVNLVIPGPTPGTSRTRAVKITRVTDSGARSIEAMRAEAEVYAPPLPGSQAPSISTPVTYGAALLEIMDLPVLHDGDPQYAPYAVATSSPFAGVTVVDSATGADFAVDTTLPIKGTVGETVFDFYSGPTAYFDVVNTLRVKLHSGELSSLSQEAILSGGANALAIANSNGDWEILQFCNAELVAAGIYDLSQLLRGRLGSEHAMRSPVPAGAAAVLLDGALGQLQASLSERGIARFYRWGPSKLAQTDPAWQQTTFTMRAVGLMPWSPVHIAGSWNGSGDVTIGWVRRTRLGGTWTDDADVPLNEESERYEVEVVDGGGNVLRTIAANSPSCVYTAAQQVADFGAAPTTLTVHVYQLSATVGRGWPGSATLWK